MIVAASVHTSNGLWNQDGGIELPMFYAITAAALGFTGAGSASLDGLLGLDSDPAFATAAVLVGISGAVIALTGAQRALDEDAAREAAPRELVPEMQRPRRAA
jgi:putative oxidoreductase